MLAPVYNPGRLLKSLDVRLKALLSRRQRSGLLSLTLGTPELEGWCPTISAGSGVYWAGPGARAVRIGLGRAFTMGSAGEDRFDRLDDALSGLGRVWAHVDVDGAGVMPQVFAGLSFEPGGGPAPGGRPTRSLLCVPEMLFERRGYLCAVTFSARFDASADPDQIRRRWLSRLEQLLKGRPTNAEPRSERPAVHRTGECPSGEGWVARVDDALREIELGRFEKVVLSRRIGVRADRPLEPSRLLAWLGTHYASCARFAVSLGKSTLVGASPERLAVLRDGKVVADAIAGTAARGADADADRALGNSLRNDGKSRREQRLVVNEIVRSLKPLCTTLGTPGAPQLMKLSGLQHLWNPIHGCVKPGVSLLQVAARLHPTPAVGGTPRREALNWLREKEGCERGWYTGALGWLNADGSGELWVVLRCALVRGLSAELFAGAGIVRGSDPDAELRETEWKFRTMLDALSS